NASYGVASSDPSSASPDERVMKHEYPRSPLAHSVTSPAYDSCQVRSLSSAAASKSSSASASHSVGVSPCQPSASRYTVTSGPTSPRYNSWAECGCPHSTTVNSSAHTVSKGSIHSP